MLVCKAVVKIIRYKLKLKLFDSFSQNSPVLNAIKIGFSVLELIHEDDHARRHISCASTHLFFPDSTSLFGIPHACCPDSVHARSW
jgi:hypothetical protein